MAPETGPEAGPESGPETGTATGPATQTCDACGRREDDAAALLTWSTSVERGRLRRFCGACSRRHLRAMEGKLDREWW